MIGDTGRINLAESVIRWIERKFQPADCNSEEFFYDEMESQSGHGLPLIYQEFDLSRRSHWCDRGAMLDFLLSTDGQDRRLLDFGPGDGWPALIVAPYVDEVVGVEGSRKRRRVCEENAKRMSIANALFVYTEPGRRLPFGDESFDGAMAASSVEQTPDPRVTLAELWRVLKPGGRLRIMYEDLERYKNGREREMVIENLGLGSSRVVVYDRDISRERARMFSLVISLPAGSVRSMLERSGRPARLGSESDRDPEEPLEGFPEGSLEGFIEELVPHVRAARRCLLHHPSGTTLAGWLKDVGFKTVRPTRSGIDAARDLFGQVSEDRRPNNLPDLDRLLRPVVEVALGLPAPLSDNPPITAVK